MPSKTASKAGLERWTFQEKKRLLKQRRECPDLSWREFLELHPFPNRTSASIAAQYYRLDKDESLRKRHAGRGLRGRRRAYATRTTRTRTPPPTTSAGQARPRTTASQATTRTWRQTQQRSASVDSVSQDNGEMELTGIEEENDDWYGDLRSDGSQDDQAADANSAMGDSDHGSEAESGAHLHNQAQEAHASGTALSPPAEGQFLGNQLAQAIQQMTRILMGVAPVNRVAGITEEHTASRTNDPTGTIEQLYQRVDGLETLLLSKMDKLTTVTDQLRRRVDTVELLYNETITEQQNNEEKLKDNEKKLDTVVEDAAKDRTAIKEVVQPLLALATFLKENNDSSTCGDS